MIRRCNVSPITLRHTRSDRPRTLVCDDEIYGLGDRWLSGVNPCRRIGIKGGRALDTQRSEAARKTRFFEDGLRVPGIIHVSHEKRGLVLTHKAFELAGNPFELAHSWRPARFRLYRVPRRSEMRRRH